MVSGLTFKSLIHFELIFVMYYESSFILLCGKHLLIPAPFVEETVFLPLSVLGSLVKYQLIYVCLSLFGGSC